MCGHVQGLMCSFSLKITLCTVSDDGAGANGTVTEPQAKCDMNVAKTLGEELCWRNYAHFLMCKHGKGLICSVSFAARFLSY